MTCCQEKIELLSCSVVTSRQCVGQPGINGFSESGFSIKDYMVCVVNIILTKLFGHFRKLHYLDILANWWQLHNMHSNNLIHRFSLH